MTLQIRLPGGAVTAAGARALQGRGIGRGDLAGVGQRRLGLGQLGDAPGNVAPQLVATAVVPVWIRAVAGHEHAFLRGGAADLQLGDLALLLDPLQLELRHQRQRLVGGRHARVAARRKTLHAIERRLGNRQPLLDLLELDPRRGQGHLEVLLEGRRVRRRPGLPFGVELAHRVDIPPQLRHDRLGARDLGGGLLRGAGIVVPVAHRHDQAVGPDPVARLGQARIEIAGDRRGGDVDPAGHRGVAAHRGAQIGRQLPAGGEQDDRCRGTPP